MVNNDVKVGGWGGNGGIDPFTFAFPDNSNLSMIKVVSNGQCVYSVQFTCLNQQNRQVNSPVYGGEFDDGKPEILHLGYGEHLTEISGTVDQYQGLTVITSLSFKVGRSVNGPYGRATGTTFSLPVVKGKITGFFGNYGDYLDSLGVLIRPLN